MWICDKIFENGVIFTPARRRRRLTTVPDVWTSMLVHASFSGKREREEGVWEEKSWKEVGNGKPTGFKRYLYLCNPARASPPRCRAPLIFKPSDSLISLIQRLLNVLIFLFVHPSFWTVWLISVGCDLWCCDQIWAIWSIRRLRSIQSDTLEFLLYFHYLSTLFLPLMHCVFFYSNFLLFYL